MTLREFITKIGFDVDERGLSEYDHAIGRIYEKTDKLYNNLARVADTMTNIGKKATLFVSAPLAALATTSVMAQAKVEALDTSFEVILNSAEKSKRLIADLFKFEAKTPFNLDDVLQFANTLILMKEPVGNITNMLTMLGEATAGRADAMSGVLTQLFQVKMLGYADMRDIRPITNLGVPIIDALAKVMKTDTAGVMQAIPKRAITYNLLLKALEQISSERTGLMEKRSKTLSGLFTTLASSVFRLRIAIGNLIDKELGLRKLFQKLIDFVNKLTDGINNLNPGMKKLVVVLGLIAFAAGPALIALGSMLKLFIGLQLAMAAAKLAGFSLIGMIGKMAMGVGGLLLKLLPIVAIFLSGWLIIQDLIMYMKYGESASFFGPMISKAGGMIYHFVENWIKPPIMDVINFFKGVWNDIRTWWDSLWSDPWKALREAVVPDWLLSLIESSRLGGGAVKNQYAPTGMFMSAVQGATAVSIGAINVSATMPPGTTEQQLQAFKTAINPVVEDMFTKKLVNQVNRQRK